MSDYLRGLRRAAEIASAVFAKHKAAAARLRAVGEYDAALNHDRKADTADNIRRQIEQEKETDAGT